jgi:hypothetical protein
VRLYIQVSARFTYGRGSIIADAPQVALCPPLLLNLQSGCKMHIVASIVRAPLGCNDSKRADTLIGGAGSTACHSISGHNLALLGSSENLTPALTVT